MPRATDSERAQRRAFTPPEVARLYALTTEAVMGEIRRGRLAAMRVDGQLVITHRQLKAWERSATANARP